MICKCTSRSARFAISILTAIVSIALIVIIEALPQRLKQDQQFINHVCLLQVIGSVFLFVGSVKFNNWYFLPWLVSAVIFTYTLIYKSIFYWFHLSENPISFLVICVLYICAAFWIFFAHAVLIDFQEMNMSMKTGMQTFEFV